MWATRIGMIHIHSITVDIIVNLLVDNHWCWIIRRCVVAIQKSFVWTTVNIKVQLACPSRRYFAAFSSTYITLTICLCHYQHEHSVNYLLVINSIYTHYYLKPNQINNHEQWTNTITLTYTQPDELVIDLTDVDVVLSFAECVRNLSSTRMKSIWNHNVQLHHKVQSKTKIQHQIDDILLYLIIIFGKV